MSVVVVYYLFSRDSSFYRYGCCRRGVQCFISLYQVNGIRRWADIVKISSCKFMSCLENQAK